MSFPAASKVTRPSYSCVTTFQPARSSVLLGISPAAGSTLLTVTMLFAGAEADAPEDVPPEQPYTSLEDATSTATAVLVIKRCTVFFMCRFLLWGNARTIGAATIAFYQTTLQGIEDIAPRTQLRWHACSRFQAPLQTRQRGCDDVVSPHPRNQSHADYALPVMYYLARPDSRSALKPPSRSSMMSSMFSRPMDRRIVP